MGSDGSDTYHDSIWLYDGSAGDSLEAEAGLFDSQ